MLGRLIEHILPGTIYPGKGNFGVIFEEDFDGVLVLVICRLVERGYSTMVNPTSRYSDSPRFLEVIRLLGPAHVLRCGEVASYYRGSLH